jgi:hypothetical protein
VSTETATTSSQMDGGRPPGMGRRGRAGGTVELNARRSEVRVNMRGRKYGMVGEDGTRIAVADRVGRKNQTVEADDRTFEFHRASLWRQRRNCTLRGGARAQQSGTAPGAATRRRTFLAYRCPWRSSSSHWCSPCGIRTLPRLPLPGESASRSRCAKEEGSHSQGGEPHRRKVRPVRYALRALTVERRGSIL